MTKIRQLLLIAAAFAGVCSAQYQEHSPITVTAPKDAHPFFRSQSMPRWSQLTPEQALADAREAVRLTRERIQAILTIAPEDATFENTFLAVDEATDELQCVLLSIQHLTYVADSEENRVALEEIARLLTDCTAEIFCNERLWALMQHAATPEKAARLSPVKQRAMQQCIDIFVDNGINLSAEKKAVKTELEKEMLKISMLYEKNLQDFTQTWELHITQADELMGVPPEIMEALALAAQETGREGWLITLRDETAPSVMAFCTVEATRKKCWHAIYGFGVGTPYDNVPVIEALMEKRQAFAELLGFKNFADYEARTRMVHNGDAALAFVDTMIALLKPAYDEESREMLAAYGQFLGHPVTKLQPWDELQAMSIYLGHKSTNVSMMLHAYLTCEDVINGMFTVYGELLGIEIKELPSAYVQPGETCPEGVIEVWHPDVKSYAMYDKDSGTCLGVFYFDLYRRADKRSGAWCAPIRLATPGPGGEIVEPHVVALVSNFAPPYPGQPNLMVHDDVIVLFHEFGHMLHHLMSHTELKGHCAMGIAWDFSEFPSTLSENWAWSPEVLSTFARHYSTGRPCPQVILDYLVDSRSILRATTYMDTLRKAKLDLEIHINYQDKFKGKSIDEVSHELANACQLPYASVPYSPLRNLPHCFSGGYAAGVYSYIWSEVMAADAYTLFAEHGMMNPEIGKRYRETILEKGDSIPADELYRMFMGRDPEPGTFLKVHQLNR